MSSVGTSGILRCANGAGWAPMAALAAAALVWSACAAESEMAPTAHVVRKADLSDIKKAGELRVLMTEDPEFSGLHRGVSPRDHELALLVKFAEKIGVTLKIVYVAAFPELIPSLLNGTGDLIADNISITTPRRRILSFSEPLALTRNFVIARSGNEAVSSAADFAGKTLTIETGTSYWTDARELLKKCPTLKLQPAPSGVDTEEILCGIVNGKYELTVADSNYVDAFLMYCPEIKIVHQFDQTEQTAWAMRKENAELRKAVDEFLKEELPKFAFNTAKGDLPAIKKRGILRVLTRNNLYCYYLAKDQARGFEHDLAKEFAKRQGMTAVMIVPPKWGDIIPWLLDGRGDVVAAQMTITPERAKAPGIAFCSPYCEVREVVVARNNDKISSAADLAGRKIFVRRRSSFWRTLEKLRAAGGDFQLQAAPEELETSQIMDKVAKGEFDLTLADDNLARNEIASRSDLKIAFALEEPRRYGWLTRSEDKLLRGEIDAFFKKEYRGVFYNVSYRKYYANASAAQRVRSIRESGAGDTISPFDALIKKHAEENGFDWLLVAAQIKQESGFEPNLVNDFNCHGLMQLSKPTIDMMKCANPLSPDDNIRAGTAFLKRLYNRFDSGIAHDDRICFALASYNAGYGHVIAARVLAAKLKLDNTKWFGNVETALGYLSKPEYASKAKYGYCRSSETLPYVREIYYRHRDYRQSFKPAAKPSGP